MQGRFFFYGLGAGTYAITTLRPGQDNRPGAYLVRPTTLVLGEDQRLTGYLLRLPPRSLVSGKVVDHEGHPVMDSRVAAMQWEQSTHGPVLGEFFTAVTGLSGEYSLTIPTPGRYIISAGPPAAEQIEPVNAAPSAAMPKPQRGDAVVYYGGGTDPAKAKLLAVAAGSDFKDIDLKLAAAKEVSLRGRVISPDGSPATPASVSLWPWVPLNVAPGMANSPAGPDGSFLFGNVVPGIYMLAARQGVGSFGFDGAPAAVQQIKVSGKNMDGLALKLAPAFDVEGTVIADAGGACNPLGAIVSLTPLAPQYYTSDRQPVRVGNGRKFTIHGVSAETYRIIYDGAGACYLKSVSYGGREWPPAAVPFGGPGALTLNFARFSATIDITVLGGEPKPPAQLTVTALPVANDTRRMRYATRTATPGVYSMEVAPGAYRVYAWQPDESRTMGIWEILAGFAPRAPKVTVKEAGHVAVKVRAIPASELADPQPPNAPPTPPPAKGGISGQVINAATDEPMVGATVTLRGNGATAAATTTATSGEQGRFEFAGLEPGSYGVSLTGLPGQVSSGSARPATYGGEQSPVVGEGEQVAGVNLRFVPPATISGRIVDESGNPVRGASVSAYRFMNVPGVSPVSRRPTSGGSWLTDEQGRYTISVAPGQYYVGAMVDGAARGGTPIAQPIPAGTEYARGWYPSGSEESQAAPVQVGPGGRMDGIDFTVHRQKLFSVRGTYTAAPGYGAGPVMISLMPKGLALWSASFCCAPAGADGGFVMTAIPPGSYFVMARMQAAVAPPGATNAIVQYEVGDIAVKDADIDGLKLDIPAAHTVKQTTTVEGGSLPRNCAFLRLFPVSNGLGGTTLGCALGNATYGNVRPIVYDAGVDTQRLPANHYVKSVRYGGKEITDGRVDFSVNGEFEMTLGADGAILAGKVADAQGRPAGGATIALAPADGSALRIGTASPLGNYYFANLAPGEYRVYALEDAMQAFSVDAASLAPYAAPAKTVKLAPNANERMNLTASTAR
jgi:hypothetical protein